MAETPKGEEVRCQEHGLRYDPAVHAGCVLCRRTAAEKIASVSLPSEMAPEGGAASAPKPSAVVGALAMAAVLGFLGWLHWAPRRVTPPSGAHVDLAKGFAARAPGDYVLLTAANAAEVMRLIKDRLPPEIRDFAGRTNAAVTFMKIGAEGAWSPSMNVVVIDQTPPPINDKARAKAVEAISGEFRKHFRDYQVESSELLEIDRLRSLRVSGRTSLKVVTRKAEAITKPTIGKFVTVVGHTPEQSQTFHLRMDQYLVPGRNRAYILTFTTDQASAAEAEPGFREIRAGFTVLDRPHRFGPIIRGAITGGLAGGLGSVVIYLLRVLLWAVGRGR